jgi:membrane-associated protease RseP (regulator of RpoE activity)
VKNLKNYPANKIIGVLNLDTVGRLGKNKLLILNSSSASEWKHIAMGVGFVTGIGYELVAEDLDASDQVSFIEVDVPAIQLFSGPNRDYHRPTDQVEKIDPAGMVKIATFSKEIITYLAEREDPMTFAGGNKSESTPGSKPGGRRVGSGIMPDFAFQGKGVKAAEVAADSPAANAGVQKEDVIIKLGDQQINNLKDYSEALKTYKPGDSTTIVYKRGDEEFISEITLQER